jgi:hypothetical protein
MTAQRGFRRRALLRGGLTVSAIGALGLAANGPAIAAPRASGRKNIEEPVIYSTADWEARPPTEPIVVENHPPVYIVVHHTAEPGNTDDYSQGRAFAISRAIQNHHMDTRGWIDSGQQFTNSRGGHITEGRHRSLEILREGLRHVQGANVANRNSQVIGIENEGIYTEEDVPDALWDSLVDLVTYMAAQYDIAPEFIKGHRDFNTTQCPGDVLYARIPELRREVADRLGTRVGPTRVWPLLSAGSQGREVLIAQLLLRASGAREVPTDGVHGVATQRAADAFAAEHGVADSGCCAARHADERGLLGADMWPLLITEARRHGGADYVRAVAELTGEPHGAAPAHVTAWQDLLAG